MFSIGRKLFLFLYDTHQFVFCAKNGVSYFFLFLAWHSLIFCHKLAFSSSIVFIDVFIYVWGEKKKILTANKQTFHCLLKEWGGTFGGGNICSTLLYCQFLFLLLLSKVASFNFLSFSREKNVWLILDFKDEVMFWVRESYIKCTRLPYIFNFIWKTRSPWWYSKKLC